MKRAIARAGRKPRTVTADRGKKNVDDALHEMGVRNVVIPARANPARPDRPRNTGPHFGGQCNWRTGGEGRISSLKRGYGWDRSRLDGTQGARIWTGHGVLAHNPVKISALADEPPTTTRPTSTRPAADQLPHEDRDYFRSK